MAGLFHRLFDSRVVEFLEVSSDLSLRCGIVLDLTSCLGFYCSRFL